MGGSTQHISLLGRMCAKILFVSISKSRLQRIRKTVSSGKFNANEHGNQGKRQRSTSTSYRHESLTARIRTTREILDLMYQLYQAQAQANGQWVLELKRPTNCCKLIDAEAVLISPVSPSFKVSHDGWFYRYSI